MKLRIYLILYTLVFIIIGFIIGYNQVPDIVEQTIVKKDTTIVINKTYIDTTEVNIYTGWSSSNKGKPNEVQLEQSFIVKKDVSSNKCFEVLNKLKFEDREFISYKNLKE